MGTKLHDYIRIIALGLKQKEDNNNKSDESTLIIEFIIQLDQFLRSIP